VRQLCFVLLVVIGSVLAVPTIAVTPHRPIPDAGPTEVPDRTPQSDMVLDTMFTHRGERVCEVRFFQDFSPGGTRDIGTAQIDNLNRVLNTIRPPFRAYLIGASDPERFEATRRKVSQMNNWTLGPARASWLNAKTGYRATVLATTIINDRRGVYLVIVEPLVKPVISRRDTVVLQPRVVYTGSEETGDEDYRPVSIRPFVGASIAEISAMDISGTIEPIIGISLRVPISLQASIAPYYYDGWNFGNPGLRRRGIGLDYYPIERGYFRLGGSGIWLMNANTGYAQERALGGEVAIGVQPEPWLDFALSGHVYRLTTVDNRHGRGVGGVSFTVRLGPELHP